MASKLTQCLNTLFYLFVIISFVYRIMSPKVCIPYRPSCPDSLNSVNLLLLNPRFCIPVTLIFLFPTFRNILSSCIFSKYTHIVIPKSLIDLFLLHLSATQLPAVITLNLSSCNKTIYKMISVRLT